MEPSTTGHFRLDTALGRVFHPGTVSYREICATDSVHVTVSPSNRVSAHVDRLSPLDLSSHRRGRYSVRRAIAHTVAHLVDVARRAGRDRRCELDCDASVYRFSCRAAGAEGCGWSVTAATEEELVARVAEHVRRVHGVRAVTATIADYAAAVRR